MNNRTRNITVKTLPEVLGRNAERSFYAELEPAMKGGKPAIVIDCSQMREMSSNTIHFLLCCLEEAMKRNGDVRLAAVSPEAMEDIRWMGVDRLFKIFETREMAAESFQRRGSFLTFPTPLDSSVVSENAA